MRAPTAAGVRKRFKSLRLRSVMKDAGKAMRLMPPAIAPQRTQPIVRKDPISLLLEYVGKAAEAEFQQSLNQHLA
jgi:hypothetical protein